MNRQSCHRKKLLKRPLHLLCGPFTQKKPLKICLPTTEAGGPWSFPVTSLTVHSLHISFNLLSIGKIFSQICQHFQIMGIMSCTIFHVKRFRVCITRTFLECLTNYREDDKKYDIYSQMTQSFSSLHGMFLEW